MPHKIAAIQMTSTTSVAKNLQMAEQLITKAVEHGAELVVLPEMFPLLGAMPTDNLKIKEQYGHGEIQNFLSAQANKNHIWIVGGTIPIASNNPDKIRAACLVFNDKGEEVARYDKIHLFDASINASEVYNESNTTEPGNKTVVIDTPVGKLGLSVCYDIRFPELYRKLRADGAEIMVIPAAFTVPTGLAHWHVLTRARAIENFCYVIGAGQVGQHENGRATYGNSLIIDPWGTVLAELDQTINDILIGEVDLDYLHECRKKIPTAQHCRLPL